MQSAIGQTDQTRGSLARQFLRPPPRTVPLSTRLVILFGGRLSWIGWIFFSFGMGFAAIFAGNVDWSSAFSFGGPLERAQGTVTASEKTHFSEGGGRHSSGTPIYAHHYAFYFGDVRYAGISYSVGAGPRNGQSVTVEFLAGRPVRSRIQGLRCAPLRLTALFVLIFPAIGLGMVLPGLAGGRKGVRLLINGEVAHGRLISKEPTKTKINGRRVYKLTFTFADSRGEVQQAVARTERPEKLENDSAERIFYDPENPSCSVLFDDLPGRQGFTASGELQPSGFWPATRALALPLASFVALIIALWRVLSWK